MFKLNLKIALRNLWKSKVFSLINIGGLAIGLATCMVLLLYVAYQWGFDKQVSNSSATYVVYNNQHTPEQIFSFPSTPGLLAAEVKAKVPGVTYVTRTTYPEDALITYQRNSFKQSGLYVDPDYLKIFDYKILKGNKATLLKQPNTVVLTESFAARLFGNEDPIGKVVKLAGAHELMVEGIMQDLPKNVSLSYSFLLPWSLYDQLNPWTSQVTWGGNYCMTFVQLSDNNFFESANAQMKGIIKANNPESNGAPFLHPLEKWHLYGKFEGGKSVGGEIDQLRIFVLLAFCILIIACVNFMNLSTARSEKRAKEVGVRKAIGSSRKALMEQFIMESMLIAFISMLAAFVLIEVSLPYFNSVIGTALAIDYNNWKFWGTFFGLTMFAGFIAGSYPAFYLSSFSPIKVLKGFSVAGASSGAIRKGLVVFQFVFAACLIVCTATIYQQLNFIKNKPIGYDHANLVEIPVQGALHNTGKQKLLKEQLLKSGAAVAVTGFSQELTAGGNNTYGIDWEGKAENNLVLVNVRSADFDFVKTTGVTLLEGRDFDVNRSDSNNVIVNEAMVKVMGLKSGEGKILEWNDRRLTIVGVIKDYVLESPYQPAKPMIISTNMSSIQRILVKLNPDANISVSMTEISSTVKAINPEFPVDAKFVDESFEAKFANEKLLGTLSNWFGGFAIFICCLGLLGLALFMAEQRKKEISIRKVLGATTLNILTLLNKDFLKLVALANIIAFPLAYVIISKWLANYEFRITLSVLPFLTAAVLSLIVALLTVSIQSIKVAKANPVDALKYE